MKFTLIAALYLSHECLGNKPAQSPFAGLIEDIASVLSPATIKQIPKLLRPNPPRLLNESREWLHNTPREVQRYLTRSLISACPAANLGSIECLCSAKYVEAYAVEEPKLGAMVMVAVHKPDRQIIVSYRPAFKARNWITNFMFEWVPVGKGRVHKGFLNHFKATQAGSEKVVKRLLEKYTDYSLLVTGYSLGGATALVSLPYWKAILDARGDTRYFSAILYAGPRVGDAAYVSMIHGLHIPVTRYTNANDIVSHLPPRAFGFVHAGVEIHEYTASNGSTRLRLCSQRYDEDPTCAYSTVPNLSASTHFKPMNMLFPIPPYC